MAAQKNIDGELWDAGWNGDLNNFETLLLCGADPCANIDGKLGTALHQSVNSTTDPTAFLEAILSSGTVSNINIKTEYNRTPLSWASYRGNVMCAKLLIANGADLNAKSSDGSGVLLWAARNGGEEMVKECLTWNGADINERGWKNKTPLITAVVENQVDTVRFLLSAGADVTLKDNDGYPALYYGKV